MSGAPLPETIRSLFHGDEDEKLHSMAAPAGRVSPRLHVPGEQSTSPMLEQTPD